MFVVNSCWLKEAEMLDTNSAAISDCWLRLKRCPGTLGSNLKKDSLLHFSLNKVYMAFLIGT